ncbi:unnamed protein product [Caenorhabditis angaria]|uniref:DUF2428 domain-containing protein n=1 Tax=Caenorhabditis angaria TaxID=860376 RepID=A0A9P1I9P4_9PELO|nr:unnamed protein product [Caenorhabditis angaria]
MLRSQHPKDIADLDWVHRNVEDNLDDQKIVLALERTLEATLQWSTDKDTMIFGAATIKRILVIINDNASLSLPHAFFDKIISYIRRVWNYQADIVCHDAVDIFTILIKIHQNQCDYCQEIPPDESAANCDWINETIQWLLEPTSLYRSRFRCLLGLVKICPTLCVNLSPDFFNRAYVQLNNPTLSGVICEMIVFHLQGYPDLWDFHATSIKDFAMENERSVIKNRLLKMIEKKEELIGFSLMLFSEVKNVEGLEDVVLEVCRSLISHQGKLAIADSSMRPNPEWSDFLSNNWIFDQILHVNPNISISAFRLIVENPKKTRPFTDQDFELIKIFVDANMNHQSSGGRQLILKILKTALLRIGESLEAPLKDVKKAKHRMEELTQGTATATIRQVLKDDQVDEEIKNAEEFVRFLAKSSFDHLRKNANFNRRIMALCLIELLYTKSNYISNGKCRFVEYLNLESTLGSNRLKSIQNCLDDSYDLCQKVALVILKNVDFGETSIDEEAYLKNIEKLMASVKTRNTSAAGYRIRYYIHKYPTRIQPLLLKFCQKLDEFTKKSEENLLNITTFSVHPILNIIEAIIENADLDVKFCKTFLSTDLLPICHRIVEVVTPVVHNLSPEGYYPEFEENSQNSSQHLLVCCWRAHKHISAIFAWIFKNSLCNQLADEEVHKIGEFYWTQLTECKHRGAFECAVEGFNKVCLFLWTSENPNHPKPNLWLDQILDSLKGNVEVSKNLCATRRSAGLPHLIVSIVQTAPNLDALQKTAEKLMDMEGKNEEMRIHSMNCMKALVAASSLNEKITFALEKTLSVAISACRADWSERNAASQLFAAVRTRIFGVSRSIQRTLQIDQKNRQSNLEFFSKFPSLYMTLKEQIENEPDSEFSLLPPLILLSHLIPTTTNIYSLKPFIPLLLKIALKEKKRKSSSSCLSSYFIDFRRFR